MASLPINPRKVVADTLGLPLASLTEDMSYQSMPEWDSIAQASLMVAIEKTYGCNIGWIFSVKMHLLG